MPGLYERLKDRPPVLPAPRSGPAVGSDRAQRPAGPQGAQALQSRAAAPVADDRHRELKNRIQRKLLEDAAIGSTAPDEAQQQEIKAKIADLLRAEEGIPPLERDQIASGLFAEIVGYGPIQPLLDDDSVSEIMVNAIDQVYVERHGRIELSPVRFQDEQQVLHLIEKIVAPLGRRIDEASPMVDARLPDGSRVNAIIPPLALRGPALTIRKFARDPLTVEDLVRFGTLTKPMAMFLEAAVVSRLNIVVSGGTGSGKTTTLNVLSSFIPPDERIVTIEDAAELQLRQDHVVRLETRPPNMEGRGEISIRNLVKNSLRMRPDRIVIGEVRGGEALDLLQAMNTGHDGSLTTAHANTPRDSLSRLETMVLMAGMDLPVRAIREQISSAVDVIIQQSRLKDGTRRITHITEVQGMEGDVIVLQDLFVFKQTDIDAEGKIRGILESTGIRPRCWERIVNAGVDLPPDLFNV